MENNQIIDADLANSHFNISDRATSILKVLGNLAIILGIFYIIQILTSITGIVQQISLFSSFMDGNYKYYIIANICYNLIDMGLSLVTAILLFSLSGQINKIDRRTSKMDDWNQLFKLIKRVMFIFFLQLLISLGFRLVYFALSFII